MRLREEDLEVTFFRASGPGGQHRNRRETAVRIRHRPTGVTVTATERRSQAENREIALERLHAALAQLNRKRKRRVPTRPSRAAREKRLEKKRQLSRKKAQRRGGDVD